MKKEILINVSQPEECRIAIVEDGLLEELYIERASQDNYAGNIYKGRVVNLEPSIQAAFVDFGVGRNGFLHISDVEPQYFRQGGYDPQKMISSDDRLADEAAIMRAVDNTVDWVFDRGYRNVVIEVDNECNVAHYTHEILKPGRVHELIERVKARTRDGRRLLVSTSYGGNFVPLPNVVATADFLLIHGNGVNEPARIVEMVQQTRQVASYRPMPILFNEDDHFHFDRPMNNMVAAISEYAGWGFFDYRMKGEADFNEGYQSVPVNWGLSSERKRGFFKLLKELEFRVQLG